MPRRKMRARSSTGRACTDAMRASGKGEGRTSDSRARSRSQTRSGAREGEAPRDSREGGLSEHGSFGEEKHAWETVSHGSPCDSVPLTGAMSRCCSLRCECSRRRAGLLLVAGRAVGSDTAAGHDIEVRGDERHARSMTNALRSAADLALRCSLPPPFPDMPLPSSSLCSIPAQPRDTRACDAPR